MAMEKANQAFVEEEYETAVEFYTEVCLGIGCQLTARASSVFEE